MSIGESVVGIADMDKIFSQYRDRKIAIYGLGTETQRVLHGLDKSYEIVGLMDSFRTNGEIYGKRIISFAHALIMGVGLIIVVARPGSCRAIAKIIGDKCRKEGIILMDIRGRNLLEAKKVSFCFSNVDGGTKAELEEKIRNADVISFDLFDTLVMRQTLYSDDVARYVDSRLKENGIILKDFWQKRLKSEKELSIDAAPALIDIYRNLLAKVDNSGIEDISAGELAEFEWNIDFELLVPRKEMCDIFRSIVESGKAVYIISDSYYSKKQLAQILEKCGIVGYTDILSSCDYKFSKAQGLYQCLKSRESSKRCLHIGDDIVADIENAGKWGFETYRVYSGVDLLEEVGNLGFAGYVNSLSDHLRIGMFVSAIFNSPFQFEKENKIIEINSAYEIGYLILAPMISDFMLWFWNCMMKNEFRNIWFSARDGYLIKKMYAYLNRTSKSKDNSLYFLTSRIAAIRAGVKDEKDILYVDEMKYSGPLEKNLKERFGIDINDHESGIVVSGENSLIQCKNIIIEKSQKAYDNYQKYISKLQIEDGDIALFDFVAKGTIQMYVQRLISNHIKGFYFLQLEKEHMKEKGLDICSFYGEEEKECSAIYDDYYILETILTAPHPSVKEFDDTGKPVFANEHRNERDIRCSECVQEGILDYFKIFVKLCPERDRITNKKLDEVLLGLIHKVQITDSDFLNLVIEDSFFNRMTKLTDVL